MNQLIKILPYWLSTYTFEVYVIFKQAFKKFTPYLIHLFPKNENKTLHYYGKERKKNLSKKEEKERKEASFTIQKKLCTDFF